MTREEVYREMEETMGVVPVWMESIPDDFLAEEWDLTKRLELEERRLPNKYKHLVGLGAAAATHCRYCTLYHAEAARLFGATEEEIQEAVHYAKFSTGWSTYVHGDNVEFERFRDDVRRMVDHVKQHREKMAA